MPQQHPAKRRHIVALNVAVAMLLGLWLALPSTAHAKRPMRRGKPQIGLGGGLGDPLGPSLKVFFHPQHALQIDFGWAPLHHGDGILHANYLFHFKPFVDQRVFDFGMYLGGGIGMAFWGPPRSRCYDPPGPDDWECDGYYGYYYRGRNNRYFDDGRYYGGGVAMIVRVPVGLYFDWKRLPIDTVLEGGWSPYVIGWDPYHGDFSVKVRYYF